ncbi:hypothetical protein [Pseudoprevotella muciniphila]|uniref:hypothetical protein n=1 Tax=Pseudoprevotella muciniphila TaxID=2133944 RepID=UPI0011BCFB7A|nr:hypothetical protein [Pseudoprevotella muciniphila]
MKTIKLFFALLVVGAFCTLNVSAKKVKLTIDGTVSPSQTTLYLIVNEDKENAMLVPIQDAKFSVTLKVESNAFIRLSDNKNWPERSVFVLIPDSKHITINWRTGSIEGSPMSNKLQMAMKEIREAFPEGFHIDVFSDNPDDWKIAREREASMRAQMQMRQHEAIMRIIVENSDNNIPAWIYYCYKPTIAMKAENIGPKDSKWLNHAIVRGLEDK